MPTVSRRNLLAAGLGALAVPWASGQVDAISSLPGAAGQPAPDATFAKPYDLIEKPITADAKTVRLLFSYDCPYCRSYHNGLQQWGESLPTPLQFKATPVLSSDSENLILAIYGRLLMEALAPQKINAYDYAMYINIQGDMDSGQVAKAKLSSEDVLRTVAVASEAKPELLAKTLEQLSKTIEARIPLHAEVIEKYSLKSTPSVAIGGRVLVTPDHASGNPQQYLLLLNALVSRSIQGGLHAL